MVPESGTAEIEALEEVVIRFAGDSGDGMQLTGDRFTDVSASFGNDLATLPNYPAEIRAPTGTIAGVSSFQVHISDHDIVTPGDSPNVLVAMNPAALKANVGDLSAGATILLNIDSFETRNLEKAGYTDDPLTNGSLDDFHVLSIKMTSLTLEATKPLGVKTRDAERSKNFFALGVLSWMYTRPIEDTLKWIEERFGSKPQVRDSNMAAFKTGYHFGETAELIDHAYSVAPAKLPPGRYRNITGNVATAYGLIAGAQCASLPIVYSSYPITPASDILHELSKHKHFGVRTLQAEDEIAAVGVALGASFAGALGITATSGPGLDLKAETLGLALSMELPLVVVDVQRGGPSTGLPTKTEQSDLMLAMYGRHGESPLPVVAAYSPSQCFDAAIEAVRLAVKYMTPVILLTDGYLANGAEPWKIPNLEALPDFTAKFATELNHGDEFWPFLRDPETLARPWAIPGTPGLMHRIGGIEKADGSGNVEYDPMNHERMSKLRAAKIAGIANDIPPVMLDSDGPTQMLLVGWGSTWGVIQAALRSLRAKGISVDHAHITHLSPFPANLGEVLRNYEHVVVPEMNLGQLVKLLRAEYLVDAQPLNKIQGFPFKASEIEEHVMKILG